MFGTMISFVLNLTLDLILMRQMGVKGIALATSLVYLASLVYLCCCSAIAVQRRAGRCR
jgi:Na+-driven multidrug efflux pump